MQYAGGILLVPGWTGTTPYAVPKGYCSNESPTGHRFSMHNRSIRSAKGTAVPSPRRFYAEALLVESRYPYWYLLFLYPHILPF